MIVGVQATKSFNDYQVFLRAMGVALSGVSDDDPYFYIYTAGPAQLNSMVMEFVNVSERGMKSRGKKIKMYKVPPTWIEENIDQFNYLAFLSTPKESVSRLVKEAESKNIEIGIFRY
jgi:hypothetical protein